MKEKLRLRPSAAVLSALRTARAALLYRQGLRSAVSWLVGALVLSGAVVDGQALPLAACLLTVCSGSDRTATALGCLLGYGLHWGMKGALESWGVLVLLGLLLLPGRLPVHRLSSVAGLCSGAVGLIFVVDAGFSVPSLAHWLLCISSAGAGTMVLRQAVAHQRRAAQVALWAAVVLGLAAIRLPAGLHSGIPALFLAASAPGQMGLLLAAAGGAALELSAPQLPCTAVVCLCAMVARLLQRRAALVRQLVQLAIVCAWNFLLLPHRPWICVAAGLGLALAIPVSRRTDTEVAVPALPVGTVQPLQQAAQALGRVHTALSGSAALGQTAETAELFDRVTDRVCRGCARWHSCWQRDAEQTYADLCAAAPAIQARGRAQAEDFPPHFWEQCPHTGDFLAAVNAELEADDRQRLCRSRLEEGRGILANQYRILQDFLAETAARTERMAVPRRNYRPDVAAQASGRRGYRISGDRGACFDGPDGTCYVLLCDGMGVGSGAAGESIAAIRLLTGLLQAGMDAGDALRTLNGVYILRDNGCFSTVDLLRINLVSGDAILYKWGAAPSWLRHRRGVRRLGGAGLPPGLGADCGPEEIRLRLDRGQTLLLTTDGMDAQIAEQRLANGSARSALELATFVLGDDEAAEDDRTVVVVQLERC